MFTQYRNEGELKYARENGIQALPGASAPGLGENLLHYGANSGYQAINLAYLQGATRIILLGYNMEKTGGKNHWFGDHPKGLTNGHYDSFVPRFDKLAEDLAAKGVEVVNCSRHTRLTQFKRATIDDYPGFCSVQ